MKKRLMFVLMLSFSLCFTAMPAAAQQPLYNHTPPLTIIEMMELLQNHHLKQPSPSDLIKGSIDGMLDVLGDPYTEYYPEDEIKNFTDAIDGDLVGIGIELQAGVQYPNIVRVIPGTPAHQAGLLAGDLLVAVDGVNMEGKSLTDVVAKIRGQRDTQVALELLRGKQKINVAIKRTDIHVDTVESAMLADGSGYIKINSFGSQTPKEFDQALQKLDLSQLNSLIIDLRDNGGGYIQESVDVLGRFLPKNSLVATIVYAHGEKEQIKTSLEPVVPPVKIVVLVNDFTASASEIMAAALRHHLGAQLVGTTTFGKGVAQSVVPLTSGGMLKITTAKYITAEGHEVDQVGLPVDHQVMTHHLQKEVGWQLLHPATKPVLTIDANTHNVLFNGQQIDLKLPIINKDKQIYVPMRPVLEAMLYQVDWRGDAITIKQNGQTKIVIGAGGNWQLNQIILDQGISYAPVELLQQLHIDISNQAQIYTITKK